MDAEPDVRLIDNTKQKKKIKKLVLHLNCFPDDSNAYKALHKYSASDIILVLMKMDEMLAKKIVSLITTKTSFKV